MDTHLRDSSKATTSLLHQVISCRILWLKTWKDLARNLQVTNCLKCTHPDGNSRSCSSPPHPTQRRIFLPETDSVTVSSTIKDLAWKIWIVLAFTHPYYNLCVSQRASHTQNRTRPKIPTRLARATRLKRPARLARATRLAHSLSWILLCK